MKNSLSALKSSRHGVGEGGGANILLTEPVKRQALEGAPRRRSPPPAAATHCCQTPR